MTAVRSPRRPAQLEWLLLRVADGDRAAFDRLYDITSPVVFSILRVELQDPQVAEEALMSTYVALWAEGGRYSEGRVGSGWLMSHVHREIDRRRPRPGMSPARSL